MVHANNEDTPCAIGDAMRQRGRSSAIYAEILGIPETRKPRNLGKRGACWFVRGAQPARKAHPAFLAKDVPALRALLKAAGCSCKTDESLEGYDRIYVNDPFGNRIELIEPRRPHGGLAGRVSR